MRTTWYPASMWNSDVAFPGFEVKFIHFILKDLNCLKVCIRASKFKILDSLSRGIDWLLMEAVKKTSPTLLQIDHQWEILLYKVSKLVWSFG